MNLPVSCEVNKFIPKKTFYEKVNISNQIKEEFTEKLSKIYWKYKLSEDTLNIPKTENIEEIEIFELELKEKYNAKNVIKIITKNISYPILFHIKCKDEFQYAINYNEDIFFSEWNDKLEFNFSAINLKVLYDNIIKTITDISESIQNLDNEIERQNKINELNNEIAKLQTKIKNEKQFNIKVQYNEKINQIRRKLDDINDKGKS